MLYTYPTHSTKRLQQCLSNPESIRLELQKYSIELSTIEFNDLDVFTAEILETHNHTDWHIYNIPSGTNTIASRTTTTRESKMMVRGHGTFTFDFDDKQVEVTVGPGDFITIPANTLHQFSTNQHIVVIRFFSKLTD